MTDIILDNPNENNPIIRALYADNQATISVYGYANGYPDMVDLRVQPLHDWLNELCSHPLDSIMVYFSIPSFNTEAHIKHLIRILEKVDEEKRMGKPVTVNWYYNLMSDDELDEDGENDEYQTGKYFKDYKSWSFTFNLVSFSSYHSLDSTLWPGFTEYMRPNQYE
jgi:hypothetical protein